MAISGLTNPLTQSPVTGGLLTMPVAGPTKPATVVQPVGQKTTAPGSNLPPPTNTTNQPAGTPPTPTYAFSGSLGVGSGQSAGTYQAPSATTLPALANQTATGNPASPTVITPPTTATGAPAMTTPPNGGSTGVSQGSLIGAQAANAENNPAYQAAINQYNSYTPQIQALQAATQNALTAAGTGGFESQAMGRQGLITQNTGGILQSLINAQTQALGAANSAQGEQGQTTSGLSAATTANAPIAAGAYTSPSASTITGQTTSGAQSLNSIIGQRPSASNPSVTEFYNTQTGQGFSNPQDLANFVNQQMPGINANSQNVFSLLQETQSNQPVASSSPFYQTLQTFAQQMANNNMSAVPYSSLSPAIQSQLLQMAKADNPSFDFNTATAAGAASQTITANQTQQAAAWKSAQQQSQALTGQLQPLLNQINPSGWTAINSAIQTGANITGNPTYQQAQNLITEIANTYANVLNPTGGTLTDTVRSTANGMINNLASGQSIQQVINGLDSQAQAKINAIGTPTTLSDLTGGSVNIPAGTLSITMP